MFRRISILQIVMIRRSNTLNLIETGTRSNKRRLTEIWLSDQEITYSTFNDYITSHSPRHDLGWPHYHYIRQKVRGSSKCCWARSRIDHATFLHVIFRLPSPKIIGNPVLRPDFTIYVFALFILNYTGRATPSDDSTFWENLNWERNMGPRSNPHPRPLSR